MKLCHVFSPKQSHKPEFDDSGTEEPDSPFEVVEEDADEPLEDLLNRSSPEPFIRRQTSVDPLDEIRMCCANMQTTALLPCVL